MQKSSAWRRRMLSSMLMEKMLACKKRSVFMSKIPLGRYDIATFSMEMVKKCIHGVKFVSNINVWNVIEALWMACHQNEMANNSNNKKTIAIQQNKSISVCIWQLLCILVVMTLPLCVKRKPALKSTLFPWAALAFELEWMSLEVKTCNLYLWCLRLVKRFRW